MQLHNGSHHGWECEASSDIDEAGKDCDTAGLGEQTQGIDLACLNIDTMNYVDALEINVTLCV